MSTFSMKSGTEAKSNTLGSMNRQNVIQETNKRRTLLQDSSWIKSRPEDAEKTKEENFGKSILNRYKSEEDLDRASEDDKKPIHNRFKSDDALDRISLRSTSDIGNKSATLERMPMSDQDPTLKRQSWAPSNQTATTTTVTEESKRKSWGPANWGTTTTTTTATTEKHDNYSSDSRTTDKPRTHFVESARTRTDEKPKLPPRSPTARADVRPAYPAKPINIDSGERRSAEERKQRSQDLNNLIDVSSSRVASNKGSRDQLDGLIEISDSAKNTRKREDEISNLIEIKKPEARTRTENLDNLIEIKNTTTSTNKGTENLDNLIEIKNTTTSTNKGNTDLDDLIAITGEGNTRATKPPVNNTNTTSRSSTTTTTYNVTNESSDAPSRRSTTTRTYNVAGDSQELPNRNSTSTTYKSTENSYNAPSNRSSTTYKDVTNGPNTRSNVTITQETWKSSPNSYEPINPANSIKTLYSTSDRTVIEKDLCTYCRKPLSIDAKMILKDLNISCHATCFKCEACSGSLGNLKAGDSMWIYKQKIHCEPCYFSAREKWII